MGKKRLLLHKDCNNILSKELLMLIISNLDAQDLLKVEKTSHSFYDMINPVLWRVLFLNKYKHTRDVVHRHKYKHTLEHPSAQHGIQNKSLSLLNSSVNLHAIPVPHNPKAAVCSVLNKNITCRKDVMVWDNQKIINISTFDFIATICLQNEYVHNNIAIVDLSSGEFLLQPCELPQLTNETTVSEMFMAFNEQDQLNQNKQKKTLSVYQLYICCWERSVSFVLHYRIVVGATNFKSIELIKKYDTRHSQITALAVESGIMVFKSTEGFFILHADTLINISYYVINLLGSISSFNLNYSRLKPHLSFLRSPHIGLQSTTLLIRLGTVIAYSPPTELIYHSTIKYDYVQLDACIKYGADGVVEFSHSNIVNDANLEFTILNNKNPICVCCGEDKKFTRTDCSVVYPLGRLVKFVKQIEREDYSIEIDCAVDHEKIAYK
ncbi:hypothetical protein AKO1_001364 [Acrasis kona]|uniref:F-box domain-containing protein n=1 Tax=Acrasis kona TaxID=1008807 RepID=A0AAW2YMF6_9EUKA